MATYAEIFALNSNLSLKERVSVACVVAAETIRIEADTVGNHANRLLWAKRVFENPMAEAGRMLPVLLAQNRAASAAAIEGATDEALQTAVDAAVNVFATGA